MEKIVLELVPTQKEDGARRILSLQRFLTAVAKTQSNKRYPLSFFKRGDGVIDVCGEAQTISYIKNVLSGIVFEENSMVFKDFQKDNVVNVLLAIAQHISMRERPIGYGIEILSATGLRTVVKISDISEVAQRDFENCIKSIRIVDNSTNAQKDVQILNQQEVTVV
jgi:hypothetical protein